MAMDSHKAGPLKQQNKAHKHGRHKTKGQVDKTNKGKLYSFRLAKNVTTKIGEAVYSQCGNKAFPIQYGTFSGFGDVPEFGDVPLSGYAFRKAYLDKGTASPDKRTISKRAILSKKCTRQAVCAVGDLFIGNLKEIVFKMSGYTKIFSG